MAVSKVGRDDVKFAHEHVQNHHHARPSKIGEGDVDP
jgi:hypothetical protein